MRGLFWTFFGLITSLNAYAWSGHPESGYPFGIPFESVEVPVYQFQQLTPQVFLRMNFADAGILNPREWTEVSCRTEVVQIDLVFTRYPLDSTMWKTSYQKLIHNRLRSLFSLDPNLNRKDIVWRLVLQTKCQSEAEARNYFHGFVIRFKVTKPEVMQKLSTAWDVEKVLTGRAVTADSSVMRIMNRNDSWKNVLVVMDWTGSMYEYGAQLVLWHKLNMDRSGIKHLVLFNDGNRKATYQKEVGRTGGIYYTPCSNLEDVIETISTVMQNGYGGDAPENDLEAVLKGLQNVSDFDEVVLIADNRSIVRDLALINAIKRPVRVVVCGIDQNKISPDYIKIAYKTRGSLHTVDEDIIAMGSLKEGDIIEIEGFRYKVRAGELERFK
jgi:hypothetical protein